MTTDTIYYKDTRSGEIASFISKNSKFKTVLMQPEYPNRADPFSITTSTLKKYWIEIEKDEVETAAIMQAKRDAGVEIMELDSDEIEIISEDTIKPISEESVSIKDIILNTAKKYKVELKINARAIYNSDIFIVIHKYGIRAYMKVVSYEKLKWFKVPCMKVTSTNNKKLPMSVKISSENVNQALEAIFTNK